MEPWYIAGVRGIDAIEQSGVRYREITDAEEEDIDQDEIADWFYKNILQEMGKDELIDLYLWNFNVMRTIPQCPVEEFTSLINTGKWFIRAVNIEQHVAHNQMEDDINDLILQVDQLKTQLSALQSSPKTPPDETRKERTKITNGLRYDVMKRDNFHCVICGATGKDDRFVIDHIIPISREGKTELENLQTLCQTCNSGKRDKVE